MTKLKFNNKFVCVNTNESPRCSKMASYKFLTSIPNSTVLFIIAYSVWIIIYFILYFILTFSLIVFIKYVNYINHGSFYGIN